MKPNENELWCDGPNSHERGDDTYTEHPRVYFSWDENGCAQCPYCGHVFEGGPKVKNHA